MGDTQYVNNGPDNGTTFYQSEISKMNGSFETLVDEFYNWKQIRNLSREIEQLQASFGESVDELDQRRIRDKIKRKDEKISELASHVIAIQMSYNIHIENVPRIQLTLRIGMAEQLLIEQGNYRPIIQEPPNDRTPMQMAQDQMDDIARLINDILIKKADCEELKKLTDERYKLRVQINRMRHIPFRFFRLTNKLWKISCEIRALRRKYYYPMDRIH